MSWFRFSFESSLQGLALIELVTKNVFDHIGLDEVSTFKVELCVVEAVTNAIRHAYHQRAGNEVTVMVRFDEARIDLEISDRGDPMPPHCVERLRNGCRVLEFDPSDIQSLPENGMGLQLIHEIMDEVAYTTEGGVNCLKLTKLRFANVESDRTP